MSDVVAELAERGQSLEPEARSRLVELLIESLQTESVGEIEAAWEQEIERRVAAYERGEVQTYSGEEVFAEARRIAPLKKARFTQEARAEFLAQISYYEKLKTGLGRRFRTEVEESTARAAAFPAHGRPGPRGSRRRLVHVFPFALIYTEEEYGVLIHAVAATQRMPEYWITRLPGA